MKMMSLSTKCVLISAMSGWFVGLLLKTEVHYVLKTSELGDVVWSAPAGRHAGASALSWTGVTCLSVDDFDHSFAWDAFASTLRRVESKAPASFLQTIQGGIVINNTTMNLDPKSLSPAELSTFVKEKSMESLASFYRNQDGPADVDAALYAERRAKVIQLCELMVVNGQTADWKKAARNGDYVDWRQAVDSCVKEGTPPALASRHLIMILKRNWDLELIDEPLSMTPARRRLIETILDYIEKGRCKNEAEELLLYHKYYFRGRSEPEWDQFIARLNTVIKG